MNCSQTVNKKLFISGRFFQAPYCEYQINCEFLDSLYSTMHYQKPLFNTDLYFAPERITPIYDPAWDYTECATESPKSVLEQVNSDTKISAPEQDSHWIEEYQPSTRKKYKYFRYCWMVGRKVFHKHIPGGNVNSPLAICRKDDIEYLIKDGCDSTSISQIIASWSK